MEAASLSVSITGDASGLISSLNSADAAVAKLGASAGQLMSEFGGKEAVIKLTAQDNTASGVASARANINSLSDKTVTISVRYSVQGSMPKLAKGTLNSPEGLAVVNDEKGISDPRELIEHNGKLLMYSGRDVIVPLSRGDRVYTADETKRIMNSMDLPHYASGKNNKTEYEIAKADFTHYKKTHDMSAAEELASWQELMERFAYDADAVWDIEEQIFALEQKIFKEQEKSLETEQKEREKLRKEQQKAAENALSDYKKNSDKWIKYQTQINGMSVDDQIEAYKRQLYNYNAMVSEMAASTLYTAEEMKEIWDDFYEYKADIDLKVGKLEIEKNKNIYEKWQSDAENWMNIRDTYDDWEESGDSKIRFYERSIERIQEMYADHHIGWQEYRDDTMDATLNLHKAKISEVDSLLEIQRKYINDTKEEFSKEERALSQKWDVADRKASKAEIQEQLDIYKNAVTQRGSDKYKSLEEEMKKIRREEEMYALQKKHTAIITDLEEDYGRVEENKKYLLAVIERSGLNIESIVSGARYDIESMQTTITKLFSRTINAIKGIRLSSSSFSDNRNISITTNGSDAIDALQNRVIGSIAHGNYY